MYIVSYLHLHVGDYENLVYDKYINLQEKTKIDYLFSIIIFKLLYFIFNN